MKLLFLVLVPLLLIPGSVLAASNNSTGLHKLPECDTITIGSCHDSGDISSIQPQHTSAYKSGFTHGLNDGRLASHGDVNWYILQPGKRFAFHTQEFKNGYVAGFCKSEPGGGSDADSATFSCN